MVDFWQALSRKRRTSLPRGATDVCLQRVGRIKVFSQTSAVWAEGLEINRLATSHAVLIAEPHPGQAVPIGGVQQIGDDAETAETA